MGFFKALIPGAILTYAVCALIGAGRSKGGFLNIQPYLIEGHTVYWSWVLFFAATGLAWVLITITPK